MIIYPFRHASRTAVDLMLMAVLCSSTHLKDAVHSPGRVNRFWPKARCVFPLETSLCPAQFLATFCHWSCCRSIAGSAQNILNEQKQPLLGSQSMHHCVTSRVYMQHEVITIWIMVSVHKRKNTAAMALHWLLGWVNGTITSSSLKIKTMLLTTAHSKTEEPMGTQVGASTFAAHTLWALGLKTMQDSAPSVYRAEWVGQCHQNVTPGTGSGRRRTKMTTML